MPSPTLCPGPRPTKQVVRLLWAGLDRRKIGVFHVQIYRARSPILPTTPLLGVQVLLLRHVHSRRLDGALGDQDVDAAVAEGANAGESRVEVFVTYSVGLPRSRARYRQSGIIQTECRRSKLYEVLISFFTSYVKTDSDERLDGNGNVEF